MTDTITLTSAQRALIAAPLDAKAFLTGPAGSGKTTAATARLHHWLAEGVPGQHILLLAPQRTLLTPYQTALTHPDVVAGGLVEFATPGGLARRMVDLFWPLIAEEAGFAHPDQRPTFLTLETSQYFMARVVAPLLEQGYFEAVAIDRNRLYSQILDNLSKAASVGFPHTGLADRLKSAWVGESSQLRIYDEAQECANRFRDYCLAHNLLDFSLQLELFLNHLWREPLCRNLLLEQYTYLLVENVEETPPVAHDLLRDWLPHAAGALVLYDDDAGYRSFLGADPESAIALAELCSERHALTESFVMTPPVAALCTTLAEAVVNQRSHPAAGATDVPHALQYAMRRFHPQMLDWVTETIVGLIHDEGVPPGEIVVLAPFLTDALRFSLAYRLEQRGVQTRSHRPSRALREEPAAQTLLTLAALAHPSWNIAPTRHDVAYALQQSIAGLDLVRAQLLAEVLYRVQHGTPTLGAFEPLNPEMQERITYLLGGRYEALRTWLAEFAEAPDAPLDHFLNRLFGEQLSQPGFGFHDGFNAGQVAANLVESVQKFRWITDTSGLEEGVSLGQEYVRMVQAGVVAAQYMRSWQPPAEEAVLLAPAYTFLMSNRPVDYQFWLNVGGSGWWERVYQPLTHPHVLSRHWSPTRQWTDVEEFAARQQALHRLVLGLLRRCRQGVYLGLSELGEQGYEQQGPLLAALQRVLRGAREPASPLDAAMDQATPDNLHEEVATGSPAGNEIW